MGASSSTEATTATSSDDQPIFGGDPADALKQHATESQDEINHLQDNWRRALLQSDGLYWKGHKLSEARNTAWAVNKTKLQRVCEKLRDAVDRLDEAKAVCERVQMDESSGLPALFKVRALDPKRFRSFGNINGCVKLNPETGSMDPIKCKCETGNESVGCLDATIMSGNTLSCTNILHDKLPNLPLADFFKEGGACTVSSKEGWNSPVVKQKDFARLNEALSLSSMGDAVATLSWASQCPDLYRSPSSARKTSQRELMSFLG